MRKPILVTETLIAVSLSEIVLRLTVMLTEELC